MNLERPQSFRHASTQSGGVSADDLSRPRQLLATMRCHLRHRGEAAEHNPDHLHPMQLQDLTDLTGPDTRTPGLFCVVPTHRRLDQPRPGIELAAGIGRKLDCQVLVLCSGEARTVDAPADWLRPGSGITLVDFASVDRRWLPPPADDGPEPSGYDVAGKRNVALVVAADAGMKQILFLDDDIRSSPGSNLDAAGVASVSSYMRAHGLAVSGWPAHKFADNSCVCHARTLAGLDQAVFIGAGAMLVGVGHRTPHFPDRYNEDWLFVIEAARRSPHGFGAIAVAGSAGQDVYDPWSVERAEHQEIDDLFAESVLRSHEMGHSEYGSQIEFWRLARSSRLTMLQDVKTRLEAKMAKREIRGLLHTEVQEITRAITAVEAAEHVLRETSPASIVRLWSQWRRDLRRWDAHLASIQAAHGDHSSLDLSLHRLTTGRSPVTEGSTLLESMW